MIALAPMRSGFFFFLALKPYDPILETTASNGVRTRQCLIFGQKLFPWQFFLIPACFNVFKWIVNKKVGGHRVDNKNMRF